MYIPKLLVCHAVSHLGLEAMTTGSFSGVCAGGGYAPSFANTKAEAF